MQNTPALNSRLPVTTVFAAMVLACSVPSAHAADVAWDGGTDTSWANDLNWAGGTAPADNINDDIAVFSGTTAYTFQPTLDAFTVRSVNGLALGGASAVAVTIGAGTGNQITSGITAADSSTITLADITGLAVGQHITGTRIPAGTFITAIDAGTNTITISRPTTGGTIADATSLTFNSALQLGSGGITLLASTPNVNNIIAAPIVLGADQAWHNDATSRTLQVQGSIYLDNHTLTLTGVAGSGISFNGSQGGDATTRQSIGGTGTIIVDTEGTVTFGAGTNNRMQNSFTGGVTLNKGRITAQGGNAGGGGGYGGLGTGVFTINGGELAGGGNIAGKPFTISGQVWNADWRFAGGRAIDMGTGDITLGAAAGTSRTLTMDGGVYSLTLGGGISDGVTANRLIITGTSQLILNGAVTLTGDTVFNAGSNVILGETGSFTFYIGADGVNNALLGDGSITLDGSFSFDLDAADQTSGNSWSIVAGSLAAQYGETFSILGFTENNGVWTFGDYTFTEASGLLTYGTAIPEPSAFAVLVGAGALGFCAFRRRRGV